MRLTTREFWTWLIIWVAGSTLVLSLLPGAGTLLDVFLVVQVATVLTLGLVVAARTLPRSSRHNPR